MSWSRFPQVEKFLSVHMLPSSVAHFAIGFAPNRRAEEIFASLAFSRIEDLSAKVLPPGWSLCGPFPIPISFVNYDRRAAASFLASSCPLEREILTDPLLRASRRKRPFCPEPRERLRRSPLGRKGEDCAHVHLNPLSLSLPEQFSQLHEMLCACL